MKVRFVLLVLLAAFFCAGLFAQPQDQIQSGSDAQAAQKYVQWAQKEIDNGNNSEALAGLLRASDFAKVSSDISYLLAVAMDLSTGSRIEINKTLDTAIDTNSWLSYSENDALLLKAEQLIAMREYNGALVCLARTADSADSAMLRLRALRGEALQGAALRASSGDSANALARFRSLLLAAMDRYPRDPRPLRIFFEYARNRKPQTSDLPSGDINLLELALRRLPFLLEADPNLAWLAAPFIKDNESARRLISAYRAGQKEPLYESISSALNLGLINDIDAIEELFDPKNSILDKEMINDIYNLLRSDEGRDLLTQKLLDFTGVIMSDDDGDGFEDNRALYRSGIIDMFSLDRNQDRVDDLVIAFSPDGLPLKADYLLAGEDTRASIEWERYPSVLRAQMADETFSFRPAEFQYAPVAFVDLGGSKNYAGLAYPVLSYQYINITRRVLVSFCSSLSRASGEFDGAVEQIFLERGVPVRSVQTLKDIEASVTEFENGLPVVQYLDMDLDGRKETVRRFRRPDPGFSWKDADFTFNYRSLIESSQSDWTGEGRFKTGEVYQKDGSVVFSWDMDGSGEMNFSETGKQ